ncbi:MAG: bifunctional phosphopantothenoylcysteine decarboxylase/phosphopantothenate--cysteine ligase CoaBC [Thermoproteota archaeon]|nr:bifunctional phosphopantothenoylcysteine decarboxylase/phosphopantothenate--cysteine ligase CoaBC [Thermoproteota archaeon]
MSYDTMEPKDNESDNDHPSKDIKATLGTELMGKKIVICVTASVACYKSIDLIRMLIRHGAEVYVVISKSVEKFMSKDYFMWASGNRVISRLSGRLEHIDLADYGRSDFIIVYPSTANTIGKFANGIDDTPPTSILSVGLGSGIPILISPAMHRSMYENPLIRANIKKLESNGILFINPKIEEGKAKVVEPENIVKTIVDMIAQGRNNPSMDNPSLHSKSSHNDINHNRHNIEFKKKSLETDYIINENKLRSFFEHKRILISLGSTLEYIDPIRIVSNTSSGKMGFSLVENALSFGSSVTVIKGNTTANWDIESHKDSNFKVIYVKTSQQMNEVLGKELKFQRYDIAIMAAAVSDFKPVKYSDSKISSDDSLTLTFAPTIKIINSVKNIHNDIFLVAFKADWNVSIDALLFKSYRKILDSNADLVVANDVGRRDTLIGSDSNEVLIVDKYKNYYHVPVQSKFDVARNIFKVIYLKMNGNSEG